MSRRLLVGGVAVLVTLVLLGSVVAVALATLGSPAAAAPTATLTIFTGAARVLKAGTATAVAAHSGQPVATGDRVTTSADGESAITYPDGSVTRLDVNSSVTISIKRASGKALALGVAQSAGLTWNTVKRLVGAASFRVTGPNNSAATVRGTRFGFYIEKDPAGHPVVWIDVYDGVVAVTGAVGPSVTGTANQRINVRAGAAPTAPAPIPTSDFHLSFTGFNRTLESVAGTPVSFRNGVLSPGRSAGPFGYTADGKSDLQFVLGWPGSIFELSVVDPNGKVYAQPASTVTPIKVSVPRAAKGNWTFSVRDVTSSPNEPWWVIVGRTPSS